jgi:hypothetical protein
MKGAGLIPALYQKLRIQNIIKMADGVGHAPGIYTSTVTYGKKYGFSLKRLDMKRKNL